MDPVLKDACQLQINELKEHISKLAELGAKNDLHEAIILQSTALAKVLVIEHLLVHSK